MLYLWASQMALEVKNKPANAGHLRDAPAQGSWEAPPAVEKSLCLGLF